jgi:hypothetical protein
MDREATERRLRDTLFAFDRIMVPFVDDEAVTPDEAAQIAAAARDLYAIVLDIRHDLERETLVLDDPL